MAQTSQISITKSSWTQVTGVSAGMMFHLQGRFSFYLTYSDSTPTVDTGYLIEDNKDTISSIASFIGQSFGTLWVKSKDQDQVLTVTTGTDVATNSATPVDKLEVTIPISTDTSNAIALNGKQIVAVIFPAAFTGATIKFQNATEIAGTYRDVNKVDSTDVYAITKALNDQQPVDLWVTYGLSNVKIVSDSSELAQRTLYLVVK